MWAAYGDSVAGLRSRGVPCRVVASMVRYLPLDAPVWRQADPRMALTSTERMLADLIDQVRELAWIVATVYAKRGHHLARPVPYPRPGDRNEPRDGGFVPGETFGSPSEFTAWRDQRLRGA